MNHEVCNLAVDTGRAMLMVQITLSATLLLMATFVRWQEAGNYSRALLGVSYWWKEIVIAGLIWTLFGVGEFWLWMASGAFIVGDVGLVIGAGIWLKTHRAN